MRRSLQRIQWMGVKGSRGVYPPWASADPRTPIPRYRPPPSAAVQAPLQRSACPPCLAPLLVPLLANPACTPCLHPLLAPSACNPLLAPTACNPLLVPLLAPPACNPLLAPLLADMLGYHTQLSFLGTNLSAVVRAAALHAALLPDYTSVVHA